MPCGTRYDNSRYTKETNIHDPRQRTTILFVHSVIGKTKLIRVCRSYGRQQRVVFLSTWALIKTLDTPFWPSRNRHVLDCSFSRLQWLCHLSLSVLWAKRSVRLKRRLKLGGFSAARIYARIYAMLGLLPVAKRRSCLGYGSGDRHYVILREPPG